MAELLILAEPTRRSDPLRTPPRFALWQLGFRPFYLLASAFAAVSIAAWAGQVDGWGRPYLAGAVWHAHEMVFGFALAVVTGFLFTAVRNWTNERTPTGGALAFLALLWLAGRILVATPFDLAAAIVGPLFPLACAVGIAIPLVKAGNQRNYFFVAVFVALAASDAVFHLTQRHLLDIPPGLGIRVALDLLLIVMAAIAGRVVPMFTNSGVRGADAVSIAWLDRTSLALLLALVIADAFQLQGPALALLAGCAALAHGVRWLLWRPWRTSGNALVWALHVAYVWIPVHLAMRSGVALGWPHVSAATHALTVGAVGGLTLAMMTRTALGHTGRALIAGGIERLIYLLAAAAALVRVFVPIAVPQWYLGAVVSSAFLWSAAFALYLVRYGPMLVRARVDGKPG
ncbi:MAG: NnrS family protein [Caldimonas sp.]